MTVPDPVTAIVAFLRADAEVSALVGTRVFGGELPDAESVSMPRKAAVVSAIGSPAGVGTRSLVEAGTVRMDVRSYGETPYEAIRVHWAVYEALKHMSRTVQDGTLLHDAVIEGGPLSLRDPDTDWPFALGSYRVLAAEVAVT